ncbi:Copper transport outer membrane protein, MctB [Modestobacter sp. DSM 44400]|uniref:copper transporter n=1 Tax=Modestobacter sp. DSM 44400 TaxID=1550230 RepID=UPI00089C8B13|nr:copper transporter [Modestobacter sp. DSM 44400]SDX97957.1 Copper transport outer membrane protein, MctB [Modestobacter sp. DSM 44400]
MIDFRYHLVSLIAVFLAVALGIVIGTTQLNGPLTTNLQGQVSNLQQDKRELEGQTQQLQSRLNDVGGFEEAVGPTLVQNTLADRSVVLVIGNNDVPADVVEGITALLGAAGATVTGSVRLTSDYSDPQSETNLQGYLAGPGLPPGVTLPPDTEDTGKMVASVLAQVLMVPGAGDAGAGTTPDQTATSSVLAGLEELGALSSDTSSVSPADFAVFLTAGAFPSQDAEARNASLVQLVTALDRQGSGAVVAGDTASTGDGGLVAAIRGDATVSPAVSTVDNVDTAAGRVSTVLAAAAEGRDTSGAYGTGEDAQPVPPPAR